MRRCDTMKTTVTTNACVGLPGFGAVKDGPPPWLALLPGLLPTTPSVKDNPQTNPSITPVDTGGHGMPVTGMYFFHPDYQGSVSMVTNAEGQYVSGVDVTTGRSHISYHPYGDINRTNSDGPDIFKFKYTGQEEDPETGLMYYKARYYDPALGRFIQPDALTHPDQVAGMNRYAYGANNPVAHTDPDGKVVLGVVAIHGISSFMKPGCGNFTYGKYTGPGNCHGVKNLKGDDVQFFLTWAHYNRNDPHPLVGDLGDHAAVIMYYLNYRHSTAARTEVDKASRMHDRSADQYAGGADSTNKSAYQGNLHWMDRTTSLWQGKVSPVPTSKMAAATRKLAKKSALGNKAGSRNYNLGRDVAVELEYNWRILSEWSATISGVMLFSMNNMFNYVTDTTVDRKVRQNKFFYKAREYSMALNLDPMLVLQYLYFNHVVHSYFKSKYKAFAPKGISITL